jgi:hypothetical protein
VLYSRYAIRLSRGAGMLEIPIAAAAVAWNAGCRRVVVETECGL